MNTDKLKNAYETFLLWEKREKKRSDSEMNYRLLAINIAKELISEKLASN